MHNLKYYVISFAVILIVLATAVFNLRKPEKNDTSIAAIEPPKVLQRHLISAEVNPTVVVANNSKLGLSIASLTGNLIALLKDFKPSYLRDEQLLLSHASIPEFLDICVRVGANPWIVIPDSIDDNELEALGLYLGQNNSHFSNVILERGNGERNLIFSAKQISYANAPIVDEAISRIAENAGGNLHMTVAQELNQNNEPNLTLESGNVLARAVIGLLPLKPSPLMFSRTTEDPSLILTPADLAVIMLNEVIGGSLHEIKQIQENGNSLPFERASLTMAAFRTADNWVAAITSTHPSSVDLVVQFPDDGRALPSSVKILQAENNKIIHQPAQIKERKVAVSIPANGFIILVNSSLEGSRE